MYVTYAAHAEHAQVVALIKFSWLLKKKREDINMKLGEQKEGREGGKEREGRRVGGREREREA